MLVFLNCALINFDFSLKFALEIVVSFFELVAPEKPQIHG
ncbi:hypothetical protein [Methylomonas fluvii]|nr:hypothetical protein [Methylomonas fluvii]